MHKHLMQGIFVGVLFAIPIVWIAVADALTDGDFVTILPTALFGIAAGTCIGGLIAANFAMLDVEEQEHAEAHR